MGVLEEYRQVYWRKVRQVEHVGYARIYKTEHAKLECAYQQRVCESGACEGGGVREDSEIISGCGVRENSRFER